MKTRINLFTRVIATAMMLLALSYPTENITAGERGCKEGNCSLTVKEETAETTPTITEDTTTTAKGEARSFRQATEKEKALAKEMALHGARMAGKSVQIAATSITDPDRAKDLGEELESMGEEMERMGDSLEALSDDTVFIYDAEECLDSTIVDDINEEFTDDFEGWIKDTWIGKLLGGSLGLMGGLVAIILGIFAVVLVFGLLTSPLWIIALIIWLIVRSDKKKTQNRQYQYATQRVETAQTVDATGTTSTQGANATARVSEMTIENVDSERNEMWMSGVRQCCLGVGLIIFFIAIGLESLWGIGALVACLGVAKLVIAYSTKRKEHKDYRSNQPGSTDTTGNYNTSTDLSGYEK